MQKYFASIGGLDTLAKVLLELMHDSCLSHSSMKLAVVVTKTLDTCIANNCEWKDSFIYGNLKMQFLKSCAGGKVIEMNA